MFIKELIAGCVQRALGLPRDPVQIDIRDLALDGVNDEGRNIFDVWPWDNSKIDVFKADAPVSGVVTLPATVDVVRAIRTPDTNLAKHQIGLFNQDDVLAAVDDRVELTNRWENLSDDANGNRRIKVEDDVNKELFVLALSRFGPFGSTDYITRKFQISFAEFALREFVCDILREYAGMRPLGKGGQALEIALDRVTDIAQREIRSHPQNPNFTEIGIFG